jgi:cell division protein FtsQ
MRQVKAHEAGSARHARGGRRGKPSRAHTQRTRRRPESNDRSGFDTEARLQRLRESFPFRRPMLTLTLGLIAFGAIAGVLAGGYIGKTETAIGEKFASMLAGVGFFVQEVPLTGNEHTTKQAAYAAFGLADHQPILAVDTDAIRRRLLKLPWVADAEVRRQFPGTIAVRMVEKRPFALWRKGDELLVIDRSGAVITKEAAGSFRLPLLSGAGAPEAAAPFIDALGGYKTISSRLKQVERVGARRWDVVLAGGITAKLPEEGWEAQLADLERLITEKGLLDRDVEIIDLRYPDRYVFQLHNGDSRPVPRSQRA